MPKKKLTRTEPPQGTGMPGVHDSLAEELERARGGYTLQQLEVAFDQVKPRPNWKYPIDAVVPADIDTRLIDYAVTWYTGSVAEIIPVYTDAVLTGYHVTAIGYYMAVGS